MNGCTQGYKITRRRQAIALRWRIVLPAVLLLCLLGVDPPTFASHWRTVAPGVEYTDLGATLLSPWSHIHAFRIDLKTNKLDLVMAKALSQGRASADEFAQYSKALITLNGGFFDHNYHALGLRIGNQQQYSPLKRISWWSIFYIKDQTPAISSVRTYNPNQPVEFAVQSGPRLLIKGRIPSLKIGRAERSALGITHQGQVIIVVTENTPITTTELAHLMQSSPLHCKSALNLDGGSSSQLHAHMNAFQVNAHGFSSVSDAIIVKPRSE